MDLLERRLRGSIGIVTRRVPGGPARIDLAVVAGPPLLGPFVVLAPFRPVPPQLGQWGWRADLRLHWPRAALVSEPVVTVELAPWSATMTELVLAPRAAHALHWGERRWDRYFATAHATADALVAVLTSPVGDAQNWNVF